MDKETKEYVEKHIEECQDYIELVEKMTKPYVQDLDNLINKITVTLNQPDYQIDLDDLEKDNMRLTGCVYTLVDKLKYFDAYSSQAKANEAEAYNNSYLQEAIGNVESGNKKPPVAELQIKATNNSKKDSLRNIVYASALKEIKNKIDAGLTMVDTIKNTIKARVSTEYTTSQLDRKDRGVF